MHKFAHAAQHGMASFAGWLRVFFAAPRFAGELFRRRWRYFIRRQFEPGLATPDGFILQTPDMLIAYWSMFVERELYHAEWVKALRSVSQPLVLDVGANAGLFSHLVFCVNHQAEIIAFEPLPAMVGHINALKDRTGMNLHCVAKAVGRAPGEVTLESPHGYDGISRICTSGQPIGRTFRVEMTTLDKEIAERPILVMKIDVEGFEEEVLAGGPETLSRTRFLIIEAHDAAGRDRLTHLLGSNWRRTKLGSSDYLFTRVEGP
jgi:FkbM family methyltransferase